MIKKGNGREPHLTVRQAGEVLGVSTATVWRMIRRGDVPTVLARGRRLVVAHGLQRHTAARTDDIRPLTRRHPIFRLIGAGRGGTSRPGARDKHALLDR